MPIALEASPWQKVSKSRPRCSDPDAGCWAQPILWGDDVAPEDFLQRPDGNCSAKTPDQLLKSQIQDLLRQRQAQQLELSDLRAQNLELRRDASASRATQAVNVAREAADGAVRHEDELGRVVEHYERRLADALGSSPMKMPKGATLEPVAELSALASEQCADALSAQADFFKQKVAKLKARSGKRASELRGKLRNQGVLSMKKVAQSSLQLVFSSWSFSARLAREGREWQLRLQLQASVATEALCSQHLQRILSCWAAAAASVRHERSMTCQLEAAETRSMTAIAGLRSELRHVRASRQKGAARAVDSKCRLVASTAFRQWCRVVDDARRCRDLVALRLLRRDDAELSISVRMQVAMVVALKAWSAITAASKSESILRRELDAAACASTAALGSLRSEMRWFRKQRYAQAQKAVAAKLRSRMAVAFLIWNAEIRGQQARRHLTSALEDADMHHVRAIAVHRAQARAARAVTQKAGLAAVCTRMTSSQRMAFAQWRFAVVLNRSSQQQDAQQYAQQQFSRCIAVSFMTSVCQERCHAYLQELLGGWRQVVIQSRHAAALCKQMTEHGSWLQAAEKRHEAALADLKIQSRALGQAVGQQSKLQIERLFAVFCEPHSIQWLLVAFEAWHWTTIRWDTPRKPNVSGTVPG